MGETMKTSVLILALIGAGCVDGHYQRRPFAFAPIQPPVFATPQQHQGPVHTQVSPDGFGGYNARSSNGANQRIQPNGNGGYTVWDSDGTVHQIIPDGNGGWTRY